MTELIFKEEDYAIVGAAMEVHREKGGGFAEPLYQECMEMELADRKVPAEAQALDKLTSREESQVINCLKSSGMEVGVLINFGAPSLEWKRIVLTKPSTESVDLQPQSKKIRANSRNLRIKNL
jgi:hypothetical protein